MGTDTNFSCGYSFTQQNSLAETSAACDEGNILQFDLIYRADGTEQHVERFAANGHQRDIISGERKEVTKPSASNARQKLVTSLQARGPVIGDWAMARS